MHTIMNFIPNLLNRLTMYQVALWSMRMTIVVAVGLNLLGFIDYYVWWHVLATMAMFMVFSWAANWVFAKAFNVKTNFESQFITAEILTLIMGPYDPFKYWLVIFLASFLAMAVKYILVYGKRHVFNPAAAGVLATALLLGQGASWWVGGRLMLPVVAIGGALIVQKLRYWPMVGTFLGTYLGLLAMTLLAQGADSGTIILAWKSTILDSALLFFASVMLVEPATAPRTPGLRAGYGASVAAIMVFLPLLFPTYGYSIETGLLLGNFLFFMFTAKIQRQTLKLAEKIEEGGNVTSFWFTPAVPMHFKAGQYLEWTLAHPKHDSRGIRRYFTISSSPTQGRLRLSTKFYPQPSTFKQTLAAMAPGDEIVVSQLSGNFTLPEDQSQKLAFIAGGIGVTPFLSMAGYLTDSQQKRDMVLLYANKTETDIAFLNELQRAAKSGLRLINVLSEPGPQWTGEKGFVTANTIKKAIPDWQERIFYISGPEPMVQAVSKELAGLGLPAGQIKRDFFPGY